MNNPIYKIENLEYKNKKQILIKIKNFEIHRGACYLFKGDMAVGKTLLLDLLTKNNSKYNGDITYNDKNLKSISKWNYKSEISVVSQIQSKPFFINVYKYIYNIVNKKNDSKKSIKYTNNIIKAMNINHFTNDNVRSLTPSQFRWVDLAAKIASNPKVLFIDEMEQHLSRDNIKILSKLLYRKCNYDGVTLICSSQNADLFISLTSVVITLKHGRISSLRSRSNKKN